VDDAGGRPIADRESAGFWAGLSQHRLALQRCDDCGRHRFPPLPRCPWCGGAAASAVDAAGTGTVYSWVTVHRAFTPGQDEHVPYVVAAVALTEGCRVFGRLDARREDLRVDLPVTAVFADHDDWTELRFAPRTA
jgi:uncharacterized protein